MSWYYIYGKLWLGKGCYIQISITMLQEETSLLMSHDNVAQDLFWIVMISKIEMQLSNTYVNI
jgi:hypothetical protein